MKILVFSDSHGETTWMHQIIQKGNWDMVLHLGDCYDDFQEIESCYDIPMHGVIGNVDYLHEGPVHELLIVDDIRIFMTHGHRYRVKHHLLHFREKAISERADIALYGHTHVAYVESDKMIVMNPGSISRPKENGPSYGVIHINNRKVSTEVIYI